ncbi:TPA: hypothetical protein I8235_003215 [Kluyvera intermedia]|nr:hypothetical protein [Kluyvera intermedia]
MKFEGTPGEWVADIRGGCAAIYPKERTNDTPGCHRDDERNIAYSSKGSNYDEVAGHWSLDPSVEHDFRLMAAAPELLEALQDALHAYDKHGEHSEWDFARSAIAKAIGKEE